VRKDGAILAAPRRAGIQGSAFSRLRGTVGIAVSFMEAVKALGQFWAVVNVPPSG